MCAPANQCIRNSPSQPSACPAGPLQSRMLLHERHRSSTRPTCSGRLLPACRRQGRHGCSCDLDTVWGFRMSRLFLQLVATSAPNSQEVCILVPFPAKVNLAKCLLTGEGVATDQTEAQRLLMVAADHGHPAGLSFAQFHKAVHPAPAM